MNREVMMFYNVENLFPPDVEGEESSKSDLRKWDAYKYNQKIRKISSVFSLAEEDFGHFPAVIGLAEIGSQSVLEDLIKENPKLQNYQIIYQQSGDSRGLSVALLFDRQRYDLRQLRVLNFNDFAEFTTETRDILYAELRSETHKFHILTCHLPSQRNRDEKKQQRHLIVEKLKAFILSVNPTEPIILMGDFNENPDSEILQNLLYHRALKVLDNPFEHFFSEEKFTSYHGKKGLCFDQILYSENIFNVIPDLKNISAKIFDHPKLRNKDRKNSRFPLRTYSGSRYMGGYSDHFPVVLILDKDEFTDLSPGLIS